jgi:hypothetical protein
MHVGQDRSASRNMHRDSLWQQSPIIPKAYHRCAVYSGVVCRSSPVIADDRKPA